MDLYRSAALKPGISFTLEGKICFAWFSCKTGPELGAHNLANSL